MIFGNDYYSAMDRGYEDKSPLSGVDLKDIGVATPPMKDQVEGLKARIFQGASRVELGFMGTGKGSMGQGAPTPESYGKEERQAIRELAQINKIELSTHASPSIGALSGLDPRSNKFSNEHRNNALMEIKRAIDFAADTAGGGAVVVHTQEFPRPIISVKKFGGKELFKGFKEEEKEMVHYLVDPHNGKIIDEVKEDEEIWRPVPERDENGKPKFLLDEMGKPMIDKFTGEPIPLYKQDEQGNIEIEKKKYIEFKEEMKQQGITDEQQIVQKFFTEKMNAEIQHSLGQAREYETMYIDGIEVRDKIIARLNYYKEIRKHVSDEEWEIQKAKFSSEYRERYPGGMKDPIKELEKELNQNERRIAQGREVAVSGRKQAEKLKDAINRAKPIGEFGVDKSAETIADAGIYAMEKSKNEQKPIYVSPENIFPEWGYGSHPQELKELIQKARGKMAEQLSVRYGKDEASKMANEHIKATFDIGHANTWRKFFVKKEDETNEQADKRFNQWLITEVKDLAKSGIIGHIHVSDNFGYYDEHVTPGQGTVPIKEFIEEMKKAGLKDIIVEPAHQDYKAWLGAIGFFGSSIYGAARGPGMPRDTWLDVEHSYFGRTQSPNYIVGEWRPSEDWTLWSGAPME